MFKKDVLFKNFELSILCTACGLHRINIPLSFEAQHATGDLRWFVDFQVAKRHYIMQLKTFSIAYKMEEPPATLNQTSMEDGSLCQAK